jgi:hypothetical protein
MSHSDVFAVLVILGMGLIASIGWVIIQKLNKVIRLLFDIRTQAWREMDNPFRPKERPSDSEKNGNSA